MQQTMHIGQAQPSLAVVATALAESIRQWWHTRSETFTSLCATEAGEEFSHGDVVKAHFALAIVLTVIGIGGML